MVVKTGLIKSKVRKTKTVKLKTFIDLFAGIGGFRLALESCGLKCVYSSEWDKSARLVYKANFSEYPEGDITKVNVSSIPSHDVLCAGFPCQAFSISGKQKGFEDVRGTLFFEIARIVEHHKPKILFLENVKNFIRHNNGKTMKVVEEILTSLGYAVYFKVLNASHYGIPTSRERVYIVCFRTDLGLQKYEFPQPTYEPVMLLNFLDNGSVAKKYYINRKDVTLKNSKIDADIFGNYPLKPIRLGTINKGGQGERIYSVKGHAITFSAYGGGVGAKTGVYKVGNKLRKLTPRECARIMGFPESFKIHVDDSKAYMLLGNSVVVPLVKKIVESILIHVKQSGRQKKN